jgi:hypothetical protein
MIRVSRSTFDFDDMAELAALVCRAPSAIVLKRNHLDNSVHTVGRYGFTNDFSNDPPPPRMIASDASFVIYKDVQNDPSLKGHQIQSIVPKIKTLIGVRLTSPDVVGEIVMGVFNAPMEFFESDTEFARYVKFVMMLQGQFEDIKENELVAAFYPAGQNADAMQEAGFESSSANIAKTMDPAAKFLFDTLSHKQSLHVRNGSSYISLRTWKKAIKEHQIAALTAAKLFPPDSFIDLVADELATSAKRLYGSHSFAAIVPVPGGSSSTQSSLSEMLAARVAVKLSLPVQFVLAPQIVAKGKSHPSKSAKLRPYELRENVKGNALLIDDVATSGRHIELAQMAIRASGHDCFALSWIGP